MIFCDCGIFDDGYGISDCGCGISDCGCGISDCGYGIMKVREYRITANVNYYLPLISCAGERRSTLVYLR